MEQNKEIALANYCLHFTDLFCSIAESYQKLVDFATRMFHYEKATLSLRILLAFASHCDGRWQSNFIENDVAFVF